MVNNARGIGFIGTRRSTASFGVFIYESVRYNLELSFVLRTKYE